VRPTSAAAARRDALPSAPMPGSAAAAATAGPPRHWSTSRGSTSPPAARADLPCKCAARRRRSDEQLADTTGDQNF